MTYLVLMSTQCQKKSAINGRGTIVKVQGTIVMVLGTVTTVPQNVPDCLCLPYCVFLSDPSPIIGNACH